MAKMSKMSSFDVTLNGKWMDTVFYDSDISAEEVKKSLIEHDGYNPGIVVRRRNV